RGDDEELRTVGVWTGVGHREGAAYHLVLVELVLERVARAAGPGPLRTPALDHEIWDYPVEDQAVVEAIGRQLAEVGDGLRSVLVEELHRDGPGACVEGGLGHASGAL